VGVAAVLVLAGRPTILTCGHAEAFLFGDEILAGDEPDGKALAVLDRNLLSGSNPLDAALCPLTDAGIELLGESSEAPTWRFQRVRIPGPSDNGAESVFWETHDGEDSARTAPVLSFYGETSVLFGPRGPDRGFIETSHAVVGGDSGAPLSLGGRLYGLCSGFVGYTTFFTPIAAVLRRLNNEGLQCDIYRHPGS
jgi:hypothetical protein